jgi:uncharacterized protein YecE (DUF72 family)
VTATVRIGTCSFADEALTKWWYPKGLPAKERLAYYAERFDTVEIDSTYYRLPDRDLTGGWAERTPADFAFHIKAFGMMTRHPVKLEQLPPDLREGVPVDGRGRVDRPPRELREEVFRRFREELRPLVEAGKLRGILFQLPSYIVPKDSTYAYLEWAREQLAGLPLLVEFRHRSWLDGAQTAETLRFLESHGLTHVVTDSPPVEAATAAPTVLARTSPVAFVRFHGRNVDTWHKRGGGAAERFDYLYSKEELQEWVGPLRELAEGAEEVYAFFNNNNRSPAPPSLEREFVAQAPTNAAMLRQILDSAGVPASGGVNV